MRAHLPTTMGLFQPGTRRGMFSTTIGSLNTVPVQQASKAKCPVVQYQGRWRLLAASTAELSRRTGRNQAKPRGLARLPGR